MNCRHGSLIRKTIPNDKVTKEDTVSEDELCGGSRSHKFECPLYLKHFGTVHPDFTFLSRKTKQEIYWEHDGRMDDPVYVP